MSSKIEALLNEYRLYDPEKENGCDTFERCEYLLNSRFDALLGFRINDLHVSSTHLNNFRINLLELKELKIEEYRNKYLRKQEIPEMSEIPNWMNEWINNIDILYNEFERYEPYNENNCRNLEVCINLLNSRYRAIIEWKKAKYADILIDKSNKTNPIYKYYSDKFEKDLLELKELKIEEYRTKFESESESHIEFANIEPDRIVYNDKGAQKYLEESIREHTKIRRKEEYRRFQEQEYEKTKNKIKEQLHSLVKMPSRLFGRLMSSSLSSSFSSSKKLDINEKINIWSDKIIELISAFRLLKSEKCRNFDECVNKITIIIDIINSFVETPNTMIYNELPIDGIYNIQKNKIYKNFLEDYKITFTDKELKHPEYLQLLEDYKKILIVLQNIKLDDCKNTFSGGKTGGKKLKTLKSKTDLKNKKRKEMKINQSQKK
jgi:hypothetical protein